MWHPCLNARLEPPPDAAKHQQKHEHAQGQGGDGVLCRVTWRTRAAPLLELLKEIAPHVTRVAILSNPDASPASWFASGMAAAPKFAVEVVAALRDSSEIEAAMTQWGRAPNFGLILVPDPAMNAHRKLINELAVRHRLPVIHALRGAANEGGLISYGVELPNCSDNRRYMPIASSKAPTPPTGSSMSQHFSNPARARDPHALPDLETFNVEPGDNKPLKPGWYWRPCLLGGHGEPAGPFETEAEALADATQEDVVTEAAGNNAGSD
jgi:hypothetical protein